MRREGQEAWGDTDSPEHLAAKLAKLGPEEWESSGARVWSSRGESLGGRRPTQRPGLRWSLSLSQAPCTDGRGRGGGVGGDGGRSVSINLLVVLLHSDIPELMTVSSVLGGSGP